VFKRKVDENNVQVRFKARSVGSCFTQILGIDSAYNDGSKRYCAMGSVLF
jgi:hypothetical protein